MVDLTKLEPETTAQHLRKPEGEIGLALADSMSVRNWPIYKTVLERLAARAGDRLFEVGFGNGKLVPRLLALAHEASYAGIDFSETMVAEATAFNKALIEAGRASFRLAPVDAIPFVDDSFDRAMTLNTIYFWAEPIRALAEIRRVLRPEGRFLVWVEAAERMKKSPFTRHGFRLYSEPQLRAMHESAGFRGVQVEAYRDSAPSLDGSGTIEREGLFVVSTA